MENRSSVFTNLIWRFAERCGAQIVAFIVSVVLARILAPEAYGTIALITVFTTILQVFVDSGLGNALIQKKDADNVDFSTVFYTNIIFCFILYVGIFAGAPLIAEFYHDPTLIPLIRVLSLTVVISGVKNVQQAYVSRNMLFKKFFFSTLGGTIGAAVIGIYLAYAGYGVWALVAQQVLNLTVDTLILWITVKWRPERVFSFQRLRMLFSFGSKLLASSLIGVIYNNIRQLVIGKMYSSVDLAYYNRGRQFPDLIVNNINMSIDSVLLSAMSKEQDSRIRVKNMTRQSIKISTYIMAPLMIGLACTAPSVVEFVLTKKWLPCVPYLQIFCVSYIFHPIHTANLNAIKALGRSDLFLKLEIQKKIVGMLLLVSTMWFGVMAMAYSLLISSLTSQLINSAPNKILLHYSYLDQLKDILPSILQAVVMGVCIVPITLLKLPVLVTLILQILIGAMIYIGISAIMKNESFLYLLDTLKPLWNKMRHK